MNPGATKLFNKIRHFLILIFLDRSKKYKDDLFDREYIVLQMINTSSAILDIKDSETGLYSFVLAVIDNLIDWAEEASVLLIEIERKFKISKVNKIYTILLKKPSIIKNLLTKKYFEVELRKAKNQLITIEDKKRQLY